MSTHQGRSYKTNANNRRKAANMTLTEQRNCQIEANRIHRNLPSCCQGTKKNKAAKFYFKSKAIQFQIKRNL